MLSLRGLPGVIKVNAGQRAFGLTTDVEGEEIGEETNWILDELMVCCP